MKQKLLTILLSFLILGNADLSYGQSACQDVVYLKNGSVIRGMVTEMIPGQTIKIQTTDGSLFVYKMEEVDKVIKESIAKKTSDHLGIDAREGSFFHGVEAGIQLGVGPYGVHRIKADYTYNYTVLPMLSVGAGTGIRYFFDNKKTHGDAALVPVFITANIHGKSNILGPYFALAGGYTMNASDEFNGEGVLFNSQFGIRYPVGRCACMAMCGRWG